MAAQSEKADASLIANIDPNDFNYTSHGQSIDKQNTCYRSNTSEMESTEIRESIKFIPQVSCLIKPFPIILQS